MTSSNFPVKCSFLPPPLEDEDGIGMRIASIGTSALLLFLRYPNPAICWRCVTCHAGLDPMPDIRRMSALILSVCLQLSSEPLGMALHNLSHDSGDFCMTLSSCIYFVTQYLILITYRVYTSWSHLYFHSSSGSSINSSTLVGTTQTKNLVVSSCKPSPVSSSTPLTLLTHQTPPLLSPNSICIRNHQSLSVTFGTHQ